MKTIKLTDEQYDELIDELDSLYNYHWNDDNVHSDDCGSNSKAVVECSVDDDENDCFNC